MERELSRALYQGEKMEPIEMGRTFLSMLTVGRKGVSLSIRDKARIYLFAGKCGDVSIHNLRRNQTGR